jgi:threonine dehydrogenase-like Zn-dependent dehydrogenase
LKGNPKSATVEATMGRALMLMGPRELSFHELPARALNPGEVRLRSRISAISHGTELSLYRGTSAFVDHVFDHELRSLVPAAGDRSPYPAPLGYGLVGTVAEVGAGVAGLRQGDTVHAGIPHRDEAIVDLAQAGRGTFPVVRVPPGASLGSALFISMGTVALQAIHDAQVKLGDNVAVIGLGAIGLLTAQMARLSGAATVHVVDPVASRRELALEHGADAAYDPRTADPSTGVAVKRALGGRGVDVAIETSGDDGGLNDAMACAHLGATVVAAGFYQGGASRLRLGEEWHHNRLTLLSSMSAWGAPHRNAPGWDRRRLVPAVAELIFSGKLQTARLPVRSFPFAEAETAYSWLDEHPAETVKVALSYDGRSQADDHGASSS